jgi:hypothetical protein
MSHMHAFYSNLVLTSILQKILNLGSSRSPFSFENAV